MVAHEKLKSLLVMLAVFGCVAAVSWAVVHSHARSDLPSPFFSEARDAAMAYLEANHPETAPFTQNLAWTGGNQASDPAPAETCIFQSGDWEVTVQNSSSSSSVFSVTIEYSTEFAGTNSSIPCAVVWQGNWVDSCIVESNYTFTQ